MFHLVCFPLLSITAEATGFLFTMNGNVELGTFPHTLQPVSPHINKRLGVSCHRGNE